MKTKILIFSLLLCICNLQISAQLNDSIIGDAENLGGNCFLITPEARSQKGGIWYDNPIDFSNDFTIYYQNNFGDRDGTGADGMALVFKTTPEPVIGELGGQLGYGGINNSLIVEFDTYRNSVYGDPFYDHLAITKNGNSTHNSTDNLAGPVQASSSSANIEDGIFHDVKVQWDATAQVFSVFFDCELRLTLTEDVKNTIFGGDSSVFFGFVGSTGWYSNLQQVCFNSISFVENLVVPENENICLGQEINIDATIPSGNSYSWLPTIGVSDAEIANPDFSPTETTDYTVTITDNCGELTNYTVTITVSSISTPTFAQVDPICNGDVLALPTTSNNGVTGTWLPEINNTATTLYTFTPDAGECSTDLAQMTITVNPLITPNFNQVDPICSGNVLDPLPLTSDNGITGTWLPAIDNTATTLYTFSPDTTQSGQACAINETMTITVNPLITPTFTQVDPICNGDVLAALPTASNNNITGTWLPAIDNTATTIYTFTSDTTQSGQACAVNETMTITVNPIITPIFTQVDPICNGDVLAALPTTSNNNITGTWLPAIDNTATTIYTFTSDTTQSGQACAVNETMTITVNPLITPTFTQVAAIFNGETIAALPTTSNNGVTGTWSPAIDNTETTTYIFTPDATETCAINQTMEITVNPMYTVTVNDASICSNGIAKIVATPSPAGSYSYTWIVPEGVNNPGNVQSFSTSIEGDYSVSISNNNYLCNTDFEDNQIVDPGNMIFINQDSVPCWETTASDSIIEVWGDGYYGFDAYSGNQFIELNAKMKSTLFQDFEIIPGSSTLISFAHRGRGSLADDIMEVEIGPIGGPYTNLGSFSDGTDAWGYYSLDYVFPDGETNYTIRFKSVFPSNNSSSLGNFLDAISVVFSSSISSEIATGNVSIITDIIPTFTQVDPICSGNVLDPLPLTSDNGITGTWLPAIDNTATRTYTFTPDITQLGQACAVNETMTITVNPIITPIFTQVDPICNGDVLVALPTTSNNNITGTWSPAINNTATTIYTFTSDTTQSGQACAVNETMTITVNPLITPTFSQVAAICNGDVLAALPTTSNNNITGTWLPAINNTSTTTYTFSPDASETCVVNETMTITVNPVITPTFTQVAAIFNGETLAALPTTSNNNVIGTWAPVINNTETTTYTFTPDATETCAINQTMVITVTQSACVGSSRNQLVNPSFEVPSVTNIGNNFLTWPINGWNGVGSAPNFVKVDGVAVQGGPISAQEGVQYLDIVDGSADFYQEFDFECNTQVFFSGYFSVRDGQTSTGRIDILRVNSDNTTDIVAFSNQLNMPSTANIWYLASGDAVLPAGTYRFQISMGDYSNFDSACFSFDYPNIDTGSYDPLCESSSSITLTGTPTDSLGTWAGNGVVDNGDGTASFNPSGLGGTAVTVTYSHFNASGFGCSQSTNISVNLNTPTFSQVDAICNGDFLAALPTTSNNNIIGTWSPAINNTATTIYTFTPDTTQSGQACAVNETMTIIVNPLIIPTFTQVDPICNGDVLALPTTSNNGVTGTWSPAINNTATTLYTFTSDTTQSGQACAVNETMTITVNPLIIPTFSQVDAICNGDFLAALPTTSNNGVTGSWSPAINNTATTIYTFTSDTTQSGQACAVNETMTITVNPLIPPTFSQVDAICNGDFLAALPTTSNNNIIGTWLPAIDNTATTIYTFTSDTTQSGQACAVNETMTITVNPLIIPTFTQVDPICNGDVLALPTTSNNGVTGTWLPAIDNTATTLYTFTSDTTQSGQACAVNETMTITVNPLITPTFSRVDAICNGDFLAALPTTSNNGVTGTWSPAIDNTRTTTYTFTPDTLETCADLMTLEIVVNNIANSINSIRVQVNLVSSSFGDNQSIEVIASGGNAPYEYRLENGSWQDSPVFNNITDCFYVVFVREKTACKNQPVTSVQFINHPVFFTPNNDGFNDIWNITGVEEKSEAQITIYDRYGRIINIHKPNSNGDGWDGLYNGRKMPSTDYWFTIEYIDTENTPRVYRSHFSLIR
jgi:gliding motility-associated-like protein